MVKEATMLVLSRRAGEKIVLADLGVTLEVLRINGSSVKLGVSAPPSVKILREEISGTPQKAGASPQRKALTVPDRNKVHDRNNRLNRLILGVHLYRRQRDSGMFDQAEATFRMVLQEIASLKETDASKSNARPSAQTTGPTHYRTLIVEDDANERELLAGLLSMNGCDCVTAADGQEALDYLRDHARPDFVLLDMRMPRCDGVETLKAIRQEPRLANVRVFCVSGTAPEDLGVSKGPDGFDGWFSKPLNPSSLWNAIRQSLASPAASN
jgi:carbon storage regulator CsrA